MTGTVSLVSGDESAAPAVVPGRPLTVEVTDGDMNLDPQVRDRVRVSVSSVSGDYEEVVLEETGPSTGKFQGAIATRPNIGAFREGVLELFEGEKITVTYIDQAQAYGERNVRVEKEFRVASAGTRFARE
ncbi:MAG: hypothetical protein ABIF71_02685 [Planctomycetota bacterium]